MKNEKAKHTPGPWTVCGGFIASADYKAPGADNRSAICKMAENGPIKYTAGAGSMEDSANARLIAAAPELLAALEMQEAASSSRSMVIYYQESEESAKTYEAKKSAHDNYLEEALKCDILQDKASEMRRAAIAKAKGE